MISELEMISYKKSNAFKIFGIKILALLVLSGYNLWQNLILILLVS